MKNNNKPVLRDYGINADKRWQHEVMALAQKCGFIVKAAGGTAILMTHKNQLEELGEVEYLRIQQMNGHCPKKHGYQGCLQKDGSLKECGSCWAVEDASNTDTKG